MSTEIKKHDLPISDQFKSTDCLNQCTAACCSNIRFIDLSLVDLQKLDPKNIRTEIKDEQQYSEEFDLVKSYNQRGSTVGVFFMQTGPERYSAILEGDCSNKQPDGSCGIYPNRPLHCANFQVGSVSCSEKRLASGLSPLPGAQIKDRRFFLLKLLNPIANPRQPFK